MSIVVADTSPINYLLETGYIEVLPRLYGQVILPDSVHRELLNSESAEIVCLWAAGLPAWVSVQKPSLAPLRLPTSRLHRGEIDAIALAEELKAGLILMDDAAGVQWALERGLTITGTLGVLVEAAQNGWVQINPALEKLKSTDFRATAVVYERARQLAFTKPPILSRRKRE